MVAGTSALSITALALGLAAPAGAAPVTELDDPDAVATATADLSDPRILDLVPGPTGDVLKRDAGLQAAARATNTVATSTPAVEEVARTDTSATFRFTLPNGEVTRDGAVLQAYVPVQGFRLSVLSYLTDAGAGLGAYSYDTYDDQLLGLEAADLVRENFTVTGASASTQGLHDHFIIPAGQNSFEITISSARNQEQLRDALRAITGILPEEDWDEMDWQAQYILESRLTVPSTNAETTWSYGDRLLVAKSIPGGASKYPDGAQELSVTSTGNILRSTTTVTRTDGAGFSGNRVLYFQNSMSILADLPFYGEFFELMKNASPPPLRPGTVTTEVTGATHVGDGFYLPDSGVNAVTSRTSGTGPQTDAEARTQYTAWVTDTCDAEMSDPIPGYPLTDGEEPMTWQQYLDETLAGYDSDDGTSAEEIIYTGDSYIDVVQAELANQVALIIEVLGSSTDELEDALPGIVASLPDWDAACGTTDDGGDPGDVQTPASISVDVPSTGVAGEPVALSATVLDDAGNPVAGQQVTFTIDEQQAVSGTLRTAALNLAPEADGSTTLTATTGADGVATVQYTPSASGTLQVSASTGGANPVTTEAIGLVTVTPAPGGGDGDDDDDDDDDDNTGGGNQSGSGSLGSLFGSLSS